MLRRFGRMYETWFDGVADRLLHSIGISKIPNFTGASVVTIIVYPDGCTVGLVDVEDNRTDERQGAKYA